MYGSPYGSYSSMSATSAPMDISSRTTHTSNSSCAFPSWPRRSSLSESDHEQRPTSYLSDDDLCFSDPFDDDSRSVSSAGSSSPAISPPAPTETELFEMQRARLALQRQYLMNVIVEKEQRRRAAHKRQQQQTRGRTSSSGSKKSPKSKHVSMAPIAE